MRRDAAADRAPLSPDGPTAVLRPGVVIPDWSAVEGEPARAALAAIFAILRKAVSGLDAPEDRVWRAVQEIFARTTAVPEVRRVADRAGLDAELALATLGKLHARDLVVFDEVAGEVVGAYPFTTMNTGHRVTFDGHARAAMCAIDALGIGAMCGADTAIASACAACGAPIAIATTDQGRRLGALSPTAAVVRAGVEYSGNCAATSLCRSTLFFCGDAHRRRWQSETGAAGGFRLSMHEALALGVALFGPVLASAG